MDKAINEQKIYYENKLNLMKNEINDLKNQVNYLTDLMNNVSQCFINAKSNNKNK